MFVFYRAVSTLLRHAYTTLPYFNTLDTRSFTNYTFTLTLDIPNNLQFDLIAKRVLLALFILSYSKHSGFLLLLDKGSPK